LWNRWTNGQCRRAESPRPRRRASLQIEWLEGRDLPSNIVWVNRGLPSDNFTATFGANANLARQIVDRAITNWESVIQFFNYPGGGNTYNLTLNIQNQGPGGRGVTFVTNSNAQGQPTAATISLDDDGGGA